MTLAWTCSPIVIASCLAGALAYARLVRGHRARHVVAFAAALAVIVLALCSPLAALARGYLFSAHMVQHMLLLLVAPLLLLLALPPQGRATRIRVHPLVGWLAGVGAMWLWHERTLCDLAQQTELVRAIQIVSLLGLGAMFWWPLLGQPARARVSPLLGVAYLFTACLACTALGVYITFSPISVCPAFLHPPDEPGVLHLIRQDWGLSPDKDQQLGGLLMWVPGCAIYLGGTLALLARWYAAPELEEM